MGIRKFMQFCSFNQPADLLATGGGFLEDPVAGARGHQ